MGATAIDEPTGPFTWPVLLRVEDVTRVLSLSRTVVYDLIRTGRLRTVKEGRTRLVPASAIDEYVALLEREAGEAR
jgi:excisionase family DNA binding protein